MGNSSSKIEMSSISHIGPVREENQDSVCLEEDLAGTGATLFAVADGMGGYSHGKLASTMVLEHVWETYKTEKGSPAKRLTSGIEKANFEIYQATQRLGVGRMGTTVTVAHLEGRHLTLAHVGDSRAYLVRNQKVTCLTQDHTVVGDLVRAHVLSPDQVRTHAQRSVLTRGVGLTPFVRPDTSRHTVKEGDVLILCSDGLWSMIEDHELADLNGASPGINALINGLLFLALERCTDDNVSAVGVQIHSLAPGTEPQKAGGWQWIRSLVRPS